MSDGDSNYHLGGVEPPDDQTDSEADAIEALTGGKKKKSRTSTG